MFVKSSMDIEVVYRKSNSEIKIKPNTVTFIDDSLVTPKELKDCYGSRISIISPQFEEQVIKEISIGEQVEEVKEEVKEEPKDEVVEEQVEETKEETTETPVEETKEEIKKEVKDEPKKDKKAQGKKGSKK